MAALASGQTSYRATLAFVAGRPQISVASNLVGLGIDLPAPLGKAAAAPLSLRVRTAPEDGAACRPTSAAPLREALQVDLGGALQAHFVREVSGDAARVVRGAIRVGEARPVAAERVADPLPGEPIEALPLPASGVAANVAVKTARRRRLAGGRSRARGGPAKARAASARPPRRWSSTPPAARATCPTRSPCASASSTHRLAPPRQRHGGLDAARRALARQRRRRRARGLHRIPAGAARRRGRRAACSRAWRASACRRARSSTSRACSTRSRRAFRRSTSSSTTSSCAASGLGRLEIEATNRTVGNREGAREWQLAKLNLTMPEAQLSATGTWGDAARPGAGAAAARGDRPSSSRSPTAAPCSSGSAWARSCAAARDRSPADVSWPGSPFSPDYAKMTGQVKVAIDSGQFLKAGPGAARLLSVLSLQSLPRRLSLDFRDLFAEGFAFDNVVGDVRIGDGMASTNNLRMRGAAAVVLMEGSADIVQRDRGPARRRRPRDQRRHRVARRSR